MYYKNETTCFGLYWLSSGFHNTLRRVYKLCEGVLMKEISMHQSPNYFISSAITSALYQCFSTAGPRSGTGTWHQLHRAARGLRKLQYATRYH